MNTPETKRDKFVRLAEARTNKIIDMWQLLGNCSNSSAYDYTQQDVATFVGKSRSHIANIVRFAPSACNTQPWKVETTEKEIKVYRYRKEGKRGIMPKDRVIYYNQIDIGIFLCFLELCLENNNIEFETYNDFIITNKHLIYVHSNPDFWIIDEDNWFAAGKQIDSPIPIMQEMVKDTHLTPVIYFESTNIMDFDGTAETLKNQNIAVITNPDELSNL